MYNDYNPLVINLVKKAINGDYGYNKFKPKWISREEFFERKESDGYIKYLWSFSNNGKAYLFGKDIEYQKKDLFNFVIYNEKSEWLKENFNDIDDFVKSDDIRERRLELHRYVKYKCDKVKEKEKVLQTIERLQSLEYLERLQNLESLQRLQRLQNLESLQRLQRLQNLEITNTSYKNYEFKDGDIVYCDIPYENCQATYDDNFNHQEFYEWAYNKDYPIYFSSYEISDTRFKKVWCKKKRGLMNGAKITFYKEECIYTQNWNDLYEEIKGE